MVVETEDRVYVGPFSAYSGLSQLLVLNNRETAGVAIPMASVRAIALHGHTLHPAPREWLGSTFLYMPLSSTVKTARAEAYEPPRTSPTPSKRATAPVAEPAEAEQESAPWLLIVILGVVAALVVSSLFSGQS